MARRLKCMAATANKGAVFYVLEARRKDNNKMPESKADQALRAYTEIDNFVTYGDCRGAKYLETHPAAAAAAAARLSVVAERQVAVDTAEAVEVDLDTATASDFASWGEWYLDYAQVARFDRSSATETVALPVGTLALSA